MVIFIFFLLIDVRVVDCFGDGFVGGFLTEFFNENLVLFAVGQTTCAPNTSAETSHTLDEVGVKDILALFQQGNLAFLDTVAGNGLQHEVDVLFLQGLCHEAKY